jgi:hypothetical protein
MRRDGQQCRWHAHADVPVNYDATGKPECYGRANGDFLGSNHGHVPIQLPVAEERNRNQQREFFGVHDSTYSGIRQSGAVHGSRYQ